MKFHRTHPCSPNYIVPKRTYSQHKTTFLQPESSRRSYFSHFGLQMSLATPESRNQNDVFKNEKQQLKTLKELNKQIQRKGKQRDYDSVMTILQEIEAYLYPNVFTMNAVLNALIDCGIRKQKHMQAVWDRFVDQGIQPNKISYNIWLKFITRTRSPRNALKDALKVFKTMEQGGELTQPDVITYNSIIKLCCGAKEMELMQEYLDRLRNDEVLQCNEITLSTILASLSTSKKHTVQDLFDLVEEMSEKDGVKPTANVFNVLMDKCIKEGDLTLAQEIFFEKILEAGLRPSLHSFNIMMKGQRMLGDVDGAEACYEALEECGLAPDQYTYNTLIDVYSRAGETYKALTILKKMKSQGMAIDQFTLNPIVRALHISAEQPEEDLREFVGTNTSTIAEALGDSVMEPLALFDEFGGQPDAITVTSIMGKMIQNQQPFRALAFYRYMLLEKEVEPNTFVFNTVISALASCITQVQEQELDRFQHPRDLYLYLDFHRDPKKQDLSVESQVEYLMNATESVVKQMGQLNLEPDTVTYNALIDACAEVGDVDRARQLFVRMRKHYLQPNILTINSLLRCCARGEDYSSALKIFADVEKMRLIPNSHTYSALANVFIRSNHTDKAFDLIENMEKNKEIKPHATIFKNLIRKCALNKDLGGAQKAFDLYWSYHGNDDPSDLEEYKVWQTMFEALETLKNATHGVMLFNKLQEKLPRDQTASLYSGLIKVQCAANEASLALGSLEEMYTKHLTVTDEVYHSILDSFAEGHHSIQVPGAIVALMKKYQIKISPEVKGKITKLVIRGVGKSLKKVGTDRLEQSLKSMQNPNDIE
eukprot:CAMPEP_0117762334 /NCGR_PEP_ID=MMETSP0947-20121206/17869_1 /TAXON_ID=44440 /ORGANISM="Chattonella subsalsa, Strain CCMP2191" /LENGTH=822 /DNA_ID=CAMNT_0005583607 /DNA_START=293 /DNA_END=2761 /DNA_ORIENTATION=-